ncbi:protein kinase domain-containing protein [Chthonomonas calidirosea]|uniref:protein kinase domain-containing protein n=1 Tax=Chthonomonas calidirosea TaxID=454171 RepID=UPI0006ECB98B|nr:protein kinase [Chthonomonas calidirosea]CEK13096.1 serine/threonine protein kinase [Chthonomonas calidirosea]
MAELSTIQGYELLELIGEGPLFAVYKARDTKTNRVVALKQVVPERATDVRFLQGLQIGLQKAQQLSHPNITALYSIQLQAASPFFVTEFARGTNLKERIHRIAPFTVPVAVDIACTLADALRVAHSLELPHGDLRPQNIIVTPEGAVKIIDFGVAEGIALSPSTQQILLMARAPYHAPELSVTRPGTPAGDIYALGAILYEMLTGAPLYTAETAQAIADLHAFAAIPSPRTVNSSVPRALEGITLKCLQKRPEQRYTSAADLLNDLKEVRDALRFGKPLSWSLADIENLSDAPPRRPTPEPTAVSPAPSSTTAGDETSQPVRPMAMPSSTNRLRAREERLSSCLLAAIGAVSAVIVLLLVAFYAIYHTYWVAPPPIHAPNFVGMNVDDAQKLASQLHIHLLLHGDYMDKPRNIIYKTDLAPGEEIRPDHYVNVWYSKGPNYVNVPNVVGLPRDQAEQKLLSVGLKVGQVIPVYSNTVPQGVVVSQDVSDQKRVLHDTAVDLTVSDGPQPDYAQPASPSSSTTDNNSTPPPPDTNSSNDQLQTHEFKSTIVLQPTATSGPGPWEVRISYTDATGIPIDVIDEQHYAGDKVPIDFTYQGDHFTLRIYYNDQLVLQHVYYASQAQSDPKGNTP